MQSGAIRGHLRDGLALTFGEGAQGARTSRRNQWPSEAIDETHLWLNALRVQGPRTAVRMNTSA